MVRELAAAVPTTVTVDTEQLTGFLQRLADYAGVRCVDISRPVPAGLSLRRDGRPISESAVDRALTTKAILDEEERLMAWAEHRQAGGEVPTRVPVIGNGDGLDQTQTEAVAAVDGAGPR